MTAVIGVNLKRASSLLASATAIRDETNNTQANIISRTIITANQSFKIDLNDSVVLGLNNCIAIDFTTDGGACYVTIFGFYHSIK